MISLKKLADHLSDDRRIIRLGVIDTKVHQLGHELFEKRIPFVPFTMPAVGIDVSRLADIDEHAPPSRRTMFGMGQRSERVIRAGDHEAPKREGHHRHRHKPTRRGREAVHSADRAPPRETHPSELMLNDAPNEPPGDRRDYEPPARAEKDKPARQHPTHEPNRHRPGRPNLPDSRVANRDGAAPRAFANVAARSYQNRVGSEQECPSALYQLQKINCTIILRWSSQMWFPQDAQKVQTSHPPNPDAPRRVVPQGKAAGESKLDRSVLGEGVQKSSPSKESPRRCAPRRVVSKAGRRRIETGGVASELR